MQPANLARLEKIFCAVFALSKSDGVRELHMLSTKTWDSMTTVNLLIAIESEFNIRFDMDEVELLNSFEAAEVMLTDREL